MSKPTYKDLGHADVTLFEVMEWDNDMRTWERQVLRDARGVLKDRMDRIKEKAVTSSQAAAPDLNTDTPSLAKEER